MTTQFLAPPRCKASGIKRAWEAPPSDPHCLAASGLARLPWVQLVHVHSESAASGSQPPQGASDGFTA
eukprot:scaffold59839_cov63-Phaeocystis_antarctica.AAC.1